MSGWLFNRRGKACVFLCDDRFISRDARNLGWLINNTVYSLSGKHLGWLENGVLYDSHNRVLAFQKHVEVSLPFIPAITVPPDSPAIPERPERPQLSGVSLRPDYCRGWSAYDIMDFFPESGKVATPA